VRWSLIPAFLLCITSGAMAQRLPELRYTLRVSAEDTTAVDVAMRVRGAGTTFRVAFAKHPEYDDRYWRYVEGMRAESPRGQATLTREDSAVWRVAAPAGEATLRWRLRIPREPAPRAAWRPFLSPTGALIGGIHTFPYLIGAERTPATVALEAPAGWRVATALDSVGPAIFRASDAAMLVESPILLGRLREWRFDVRGVPHRVVYWPKPNAEPFDTLAFVDGTQRFANEAVALFRGTPYRAYTFLYRDDAYGALEHPASVTLGAPSERLARDKHGALEETAHEFFHTWNLMSIRPAEYRPIDHRAIEPVPVLWFSEGLSMFYADLLTRRAGLPTEDSTRTAHVAGLLGRYLGNPAHARFSPEAISRVAYGAGPGALGDYDAGPHLVGELLGTALDLMIRDRTDGRRSMDDVMRLLYRRFGGAARGIASTDVQRAVAETCQCDARPFFDAHVRGAELLEMNRWLAVVGMRARTTREPARGAEGPAPDWRMRGWVPAGDSTLRLLVLTPSSVWARAGLHTGDRLLGFGGAPVRSWPELRGVLTRLRIGDTVRVEFIPSGASAPRALSFPMTGYDQVVVAIEPLPDATPRQRRLGAAWLAAR